MPRVRLTLLLLLINLLITLCSTQPSQSAQFMPATLSPQPTQSTESTQSTQSTESTQSPQSTRADPSTQQSTILYSCSPSGSLADSDSSLYTDSQYKSNLDREIKPDKQGKSDRDPHSDSNSNRDLSVQKQDKYPRAPDRASDLDSQCQSDPDRGSRSNRHFGSDSDNKLYPYCESGPDSNLYSDVYCESNPDSKLYSDVYCESGPDHCDSAHLYSTPYTQPDWTHLLTMSQYSQISISPDHESENSDVDVETVTHYSPRIRSPLARAMYDRMLDNERHRGRTHTEWYALDVSTFPQHIKLLFQQCYEDQETLKFLDNCYEKSDWVLTQVYHSVMKSILTWFMSVTSANAFLDRGSMFVFSREQFRRLMKVGDDFRRESMIDLGAGDGKVTQIMAEFYRDIYATEVSPWMRSRLDASGYTVLGLEEWAVNRQYDLISCLNLLDRCERPLTLLEDMRMALKPDGRLVVAVVLPYIPYVENVQNHQPLERLPIKGRSFSEQVLSLVEDVFVPAGYDVISYTRLPYLCEGDMYRSFYVLNDAVFVLKLAGS